MFDGSKLKKIRMDKNLSLQQLSESCGVSIGMLSQIERKKADPTMTTLLKICKGLDITIASLLSYQEEAQLVVRKNARKTIMLPNSKVKYQLLSPNSKSNLEMLLIELEPGQEDRQRITHYGEECGFVISGELTIILGEEEYILQEGDSIQFDSTIPHRFVNHTNETCISIWAMTPASF
jgi:transcriptional regulator with XRE-family HTH domain